MDSYFIILEKQSSNQSISHPKNFHKL